MEWWAAFLTSTWTLVIVPAAIAIAALIAFWKTVLERRNIELENERLRLELLKEKGRIVAPTNEQIEKYSRPIAVETSYAFSQAFFRRTIRIGSIVLAVAIPATLVLRQADLEQAPAVPPPTNIGQPPALPPTPTPTPPPPPIPSDRVSIDPPPPPSPPAQPVRVGGQIKQPTKTKHVEPQYPPEAQSAGVQGVVIIEAVISPNGTVQDARVVRSIPLLDEAALDAVKKWEFTPTLRNNVPVPVIMTVAVQFTLQQEKQEKPRR